MQKPESVDSCLTLPCSGFMKHSSAGLIRVLSRTCSSAYSLTWFIMGFSLTYLVCKLTSLLWVLLLIAAGVFIDLFVWSFKAGRVKSILLWLVAKAALQLFRVNGRVETFLMGRGTITQQRKPQLPKASWHKKALEDPAQFPSCQNWHTLIFHPEPLENSPLNVRKLILEDLLSWI